MKIVINRCYGGFGVSHEGMMRYFEILGKKVWPEKLEFQYSPNQYTYWLVPEEERIKTESIQPQVGYTDEQIQEAAATWEKALNQYLNDIELDRNDPVLVQVVEELGEGSWGHFAELKVVEIPDDVNWYIDEYDGLEWVAEVHRKWS